MGFWGFFSTSTITTLQLSLYCCQCMQYIRMHVFMLKDPWNSDIILWLHYFLLASFVRLTHLLVRTKQSQMMCFKSESWHAVILSIVVSCLLWRSLWPIYGPKDVLVLKEKWGSLGVVYDHRTFFTLFSIENGGCSLRVVPFLVLSETSHRD